MSAEASGVWIDAIAWPSHESALALATACDSNLELARGHEPSEDNRIAGEVNR
jgi:hypothetical protein